MEHNLKISVSKMPDKNGVASIRNMTVRERFLQKIFGNSQKITIIVPGDTVRELAIKEVQTNGKNE